MFKTTEYDIYKQKSVYVIHYPNGQKMTYSPGAIKVVSLNNYIIHHYCSTETGSSGSPIINLFNYKVIGIHKGFQKKMNHNLGTLIKGPVENFNKLYTNDNIEKIVVKIFKVNKFENLGGLDEITIKYKKNKNNTLKDSNLDDIEENFGETISEDKLFGEKFVEMNKDICHIIIDGKENELISYYDNFSVKEI